MRRRLPGCGRPLADMRFSNGSSGNHIVNWPRGLGHAVDVRDAVDAELVAHARADTRACRDRASTRIVASCGRARAAPERQHVAVIDHVRHVAACRSVSSRNRSGSHTDSEFSVHPASRHTVIACIVPLQWKNGAALMKRGSTASAAGSARRTPRCADTRRLVSITPLGMAVVPDVYWMHSRSSGVAAARRASAPRDPLSRAIARGGNVVGGGEHDAALGESAGRTPPALRRDSRGRGSGGS